MTHKIRTLVADDEPIARARVVSLLKGEDDIEVVRECATGEEARAAIEQDRLDLLFLDIQMPEMSGMELARTIQSNGEPAVVFVTAFDQYALRAFEVHALDYLLKPFSAERFRAALGHAREHVAKRRAAGGSMPSGAGGPRDQGQRRNRLMIKSGGRIHFVRTADIDWCEAAGNYVRVHVGKTSHLIRETMNGVESSLNPQMFARIHRAVIVNLDRIKELQPWFAGDYVVILRDGRQLKLSRTYREQLQSRMHRIP